MITRYSKFPVNGGGCTRRHFGGLLTGAITGGYFAKPRLLKGATRTPFTLVFVPDTQWQAGGWPSGDAPQAGALTATIQWIVDNAKTSISGILGGAALNIKGVLMAGDCANLVENATYDAQQTRVGVAYAQLAAASPKLFFVPTPGNHDYSSTDGARDNIGYMWRESTGGVWSPTNMAAMYGSGMDLGTGDFATWGGVYTEPGGTFPTSSANNYVMANIQGQRIGFFGLEFFPRSGVLTWAKSIMDAHPDYWWIVTTHGYQTAGGGRCLRTDTYGPNPYGLAAAPDSNSGSEMWSGSMGWAGFTSCENLAMVGCGHWIDGFAGGASWIYQKLDSVATSTHGQTVHQFFCDSQGNGTSDTNGTTGDSVGYKTLMLNGTSQNRHLLLLTIDPSTNPLAPTMKSYMLSSNNGKWVGPNSSYTGNGAVGGLGATVPYELASFAIPTSPFIFPQPGGLR